MRVLDEFFGGIGGEAAYQSRYQAGPADQSGDVVLGIIAGIGL